MLTLLPSSSNYEPPSGDGWGKFFLGLFGGIAFAIGILVLMNLRDAQPAPPPYVTQEELQQAMSTVRRPMPSEEGKVHKAAPNSSSQRSRSMSSAGSSARVQKEAVSSMRLQENVIALSGGTSSVSSRAPEKTHMWIRTVWWTWPMPVVPAEGQAVVGRLLFRNSCVGALTMSHIRMFYNGPNPFLIRGIALLDTSSGEPLTELYPLALSANRRGGEVDLPLNPPVTLKPCERDPSVPFEERTDLFSIDIVVAVQLDHSDWSAHTLSVGPDMVEADGLVLWDDKVSPMEGVFQFLTGKDAGQKSQEDGQQ